MAVVGLIVGQSLGGSSHAPSFFSTPLPHSHRLCLFATSSHDMAGVRPMLVTSLLQSSGISLSRLLPIIITSILALYAELLNSYTPRSLYRVLLVIWSEDRYGYNKDYSISALSLVSQENSLFSPLSWERMCTNSVAHVSTIVSI